VNRGEALLRWAAPGLLGLGVLVLWEGLVRAWAVPDYVLPGPVAIARALVADWPLLSSSLLVTLEVAALALVAAVSLGGLLAVLFAQSRWVERALFPYAVVLQVTPVVAIAPLVLIWVNSVTVALLICAWIVAFFPILSNTVLGLNSADRNLADLFRLYGATRGQVLWRLKLPAALPQITAGWRLASGISVLMLVGAEFSNTNEGLGYLVWHSWNLFLAEQMYVGIVGIALLGVLFSGVVKWIGGRIAPWAPKGDVRDEVI